MEITTKLLKWYDQNRRTHLPWREDPTPYHVWVSEIMLQQTRVEAALPYYSRFIRELPDIYALSMCEEEKLLMLWQGLGYYSRVRNLQKAARRILQEHAGQLPSSVKELTALPGIGRYTAGAIASIAFGKKEIAPDGNAYRVAARLLNEKESIDQAQVKKRLEKHLSSWVPEDRPGDFNQALMDLGSGVCIPNGPARCESCPLQRECVSLRMGTADQLPVRDAKKKRPKEDVLVLKIRMIGKIMIVKRAPKMLLSGMWSLPTYHIPDMAYLDQQIQEKISNGRVKDLGKHHRVFSGCEWNMRGLEIELTETDAVSDSWLGVRADAYTETAWVREEQWQSDFSVPTAYRFYLEKRKK
ncbi:MAG: A/G-specific adenine glycosylase [Peptoniphilaceae bacterium]|nr:A/G-specific adenine glycosylase [Peptoniphilaceae bacterium]